MYSTLKVPISRAVTQLASVGKEPEYSDAIAHLAKEIEPSAFERDYLAFEKDVFKKQCVLFFSCIPYQK